MDKVDAEVTGILGSLEGVKCAGVVDDELRCRILEQEEKHASLGPIGVDNVGVKSACKRKRLYYIIKDKRFRPPPISTVQLVSDDGTVIGEELIKGARTDAPDGTKTIHLGKDFVIYPGRAKEKGRKSQFVLPPVPFAEIERLGYAKGVISASPSTLGDLEIKKAAGIPDEPKLASILVGFDI